MKRNYFFGLLAAVMLVPFASVNAQTYHPGDSTVLYNIMTNNFATSNLLNWNDPNPGNWLGVIWNSSNPARVVALELDGGGDGGGSVYGDSWCTTMDQFELKYVGESGSGVDSRLIGTIDVSALTELQVLDLRDQDSVAGVNVAGLTNLAHFKLSRNAVASSLDFTGCTNLQTMHAVNCDSISTANFTNCDRLKRIKLNSWGDGTLDQVILTGADSIVKLNLGQGDNPNYTLSSIDVTGKTELRKIFAAKYPNLSTIVGLSTAGKLIALCTADNNLGGMLDVTDFDEALMYKLCVRNDNNGSNHIDSISNWMSLTGCIEVIAVDDNWLSLQNATQIFNELNVNNRYYGSDQFKWGGDTIYVGGQKDYSSQASIDISGTPVASSFQLYDDLGTPIGVANATGVFTFPTILDTGEYYVEMTNAGGAPGNNATLVTTNNFWVLECPSVDTSTAVNMTTITSNEGMAGTTYRWLDCDNNMAVIAGETGQNFTATVNGNYAVEITLGAPCNTVDTSACVNISSVGIDEMADFKSVSVYPNPIQDQLTIELLEDYNNVTVMIMNLEGKMVYNNTNVRNNKLTIRTADWKQGIYMVKVFSDEFTNTYKLIK